MVGLWIRGFGVGVFAAIAALAGEGEVFQGVGAFFAAGVNVFDRKGVHREFLLAEAVFAAAFGSIED